jgi:hypothetical protein
MTVADYAQAEIGAIGTHDGIELVVKYLKNWTNHLYQTGDPHDKDLADFIINYIDKDGLGEIDRILKAAAKNPRHASEDVKHYVSDLLQTLYDNR